MECTVTDIVDVQVAEGTVLQVREAGTFPRTFTLTNLTAGTPAFKIQRSVDGGTVWTDLTLSDGTMQITLGVSGGGADVSVQRITDGNMLRVRMSGGAADRDVLYSLTRTYYDLNKILGSPLL